MQPKFPPPPHWQWDLLDWVLKQQRRLKRHLLAPGGEKPEVCSVPVAQTPSNILHIYKKTCLQYMEHRTQFSKWKSLCNQLLICLGTESLSLCVLQPEFESQFDVEALEKLLNIIPADIPSRELCLWFKSVIIPFVRRIVPKGQVIVCLYFIKDIINFMGTFFIL